MKITVLNGSPDKNGNTSAQVTAFCKGAESKGNTVFVINISELDIAPCIGCNFCKSHDGCFRKDGMYEIYNAVFSCDAVVFASPVYWWGITAQLKASLDRLYAVMGKGVSVQKTALLLNGYDENPFDPIKAQFDIIFDHLKWENKGYLCIGNMTEKGAMAKSDRLREIYEFGESF